MPFCGLLKQTCLYDAEVPENVTRICYGSQVVRTQNERAAATRVRKTDRLREADAAVRRRDQFMLSASVLVAVLVDRFPKGTVAGLLDRAERAVREAYGLPPPGLVCKFESSYRELTEFGIGAAGFFFIGWTLGAAAQEHYRVVFPRLVRPLLRDVPRNDGKPGEITVGDPTRKLPSWM